MTDSSVNEKSSSDSLSTIDPNVLAVFNQYISEAFRVEKPEMTTDDNDKSKRFLVNLLSPKDGGKYGRAEFWDIYDRNNNSHYPFVIKKNKGMDLADVMTLTTIEAKVLQYLTNKNLQAVDYCKHRGDLLMTKFLEGRTLEEYIQEKGSLPPQIILNIIDSMPKIHSALNEMMIEGKGDISPLEVQYHKQRAFRLVREGTPGLPRYIKEVYHPEGRPSDVKLDSLISKNFYSYRIMQALGDVVPGFEDDYRNINDTLEFADKTWIGYDHPRNRILMMQDDGSYRVLVYDFNHLSESFFGLDLAMLLSSLRPAKPLERRNSSDATGTIAYHTSFVNYMNLALLSEFKNKIDPELLGESDQGELEETIERLRDPEILTTEVQDVTNLYKHDYVLVNTACMYAALMHRNTLDLLKVIDQEGPGSTEQAQFYVLSLRLIDNMATGFCAHLDDNQRQTLTDARVSLPISYTALHKLKDHPKMSKYIKELF